jgi:hypothetical protein
LRKFALITSECSLLLFLASFAHAQQIDLALGASTTFSSKYNGSSQAFLPPAEKGGTYPGGSAEVLLKHRRIGFNAEVAVRYKNGLYNGYQDFRPIFYDLNAVFAPRLGKKITGDFMAGIGGETIRFDNPNGNCSYPAGCPIHLSDNHFLMHLGGGVRYYAWRNFFVRPEIHYYRIVNNTLDFNSNNVFRAGASIGYTIGPR